MLSKIVALDEFVVKTELILLRAISIVLTLILMTQVILRYVFSRPLFWAEEVSVQLLVFMTLFGLSVLVQRKQLISIDLLSGIFKGRVKDIVEIVLSLVSLVTIVVVAKEAAQWIMRPEVQMELSPTTQIPIWYNYSVLPVSMVCMLFHQFVGLMLLTANALKREAPC